MREPTRPLPSLVPLPNGGWAVDSFMSSVDYTIRGLGLVPPNSIIPVIVVPGIMGTNLRAKRAPRLGRKEDERNKMVGAGDLVWRPPNGKIDGMLDSFHWDTFSPKERQLLFDPATLEVDDLGPIHLPTAEDGYVLSEAEVRQRGWGEVHADSYGRLLAELQTRLNQTFEFDDSSKRRLIRQHWKDIMAYDPKKWGVREFTALTESDLEKHARNYFPVYAVGYNWLLDCDVSSRSLEQRIISIIESWKRAKRQCDKVVLITHSMGGLVARACARRIPEKIAGIVHGVMPAMGAPVAYRRIACGVESGSPGNGPAKNLEASRLAKILGSSTEVTTPVLAASAGALELLPNHLYPQPWLHIRIIKATGMVRVAGRGAHDDVMREKETALDYIHLPNARTPNPYDLYRDFKSWYRLINPALADPAKKYQLQPGGIEEAVRKAVGIAEKFHRELGEYFHPNTYAFYGDDQSQFSYGHVRWTARQTSGSTGALTPSNVTVGKFIGHTAAGERRVLVEGKTELRFSTDAQDSRGDGTVPSLSGAGVTGKVKKAFPTRGHDHQFSFTSNDALMLTLRLIVQISQEMA